MATMARRLRRSRSWSHDEDEVDEKVKKEPKLLLVYDGDEVVAKKEPKLRSAYDEDEAVCSDKTNSDKCLHPKCSFVVHANGKKQCYCCDMCRNIKEKTPRHGPHCEWVNWSEFRFQIEERWVSVRQQIFSIQHFQYMKNTNCDLWGDWFWVVSVCVCVRRPPKWRRFLYLEQSYLFVRFDEYFSNACVCEGLSHISLCFVSVYFKFFAMMIHSNACDWGASHISICFVCVYF